MKVRFIYATFRYGTGLNMLPDKFNNEEFMLLNDIKIEAPYSQPDYILLKEGEKYEYSEFDVSLLLDKDKKLSGDISLTDDEYFELHKIVDIKKSVVKFFLDADYSRTINIHHHYAEPQRTEDLIVEHGVSNGAEEEGPPF